MNLFKDISKSKLHYGKRTINIIIDDSDDLWFCARDVVLALGFKNTKAAKQNAIRKNVPRQDVLHLKNINVKNKIGDPSTVYINEVGLYYLILKSRLTPAKKFADWVVREVLPSIRKYGSYKLMQKNKLESANIMRQLILFKKENDKLKRDLTKPKYPNGGVVYVIDYSEDGTHIYRVGTTGDMNARKKIYNTHTLHNHQVVHIVQSLHHRQLESCIRLFLSKYRYNSKKDFFQCSLSIIKKAFGECTKEFKKFDIQIGGTSKYVSNRKLLKTNIFDRQIRELQKRKKILDSRVKKQQRTLMKR